MTDFGLSDPFVGVMKGRIVSRFTSARIIDLSHEVPAQHPEVAGFWLSRCFEEFPRGTVHVAVVDPGVGTSRAILCMLTRGHALIAPDNGLLASCAIRDPQARTVCLTKEALAALGVKRVSATFHGRDIFAPVAAELAAGRCAPDSLGPTVSVGPVAEHEPCATADGVVGQVVAVDHFGNLITNIAAEWVERLNAPEVLIGGRVVPVGRTYADAAPGDLLALINSFDVLEIAQSQGSAAAAFGLGRGATVSVQQRASGHLLDGPNRL